MRRVPRQIQQAKWLAYGRRGVEEAGGAARHGGDVPRCGQHGAVGAKKEKNRRESHRRRD